MESEKIQKLFLEEPDPETGFQGLVLTPSDEEMATTVEAVDYSATSHNGSDGFGLPDAFWGWMSADAGLRREFDKMIDARVAERLVERFETLKEQISKEAEAAGLQKGLEQSALQVAEMTSKLDKVCEQVIAEKTQVLKAHERTWMKAFSHLLRRFLVHRVAFASEEIERWLNESIGAFDSNGKIQIHVASSDFKHLSEALKSLDGKRWEIIQDGTLKPGELHCACEDGGVLFSSETELKKLDEWIERFSTRGDVNE